MAEIVLGLASSHAPQLEMQPENWKVYGDNARKQAEHWFEGKTYNFPELAELRAADHFERECNPESFQLRFNACQTAIEHLSETLKRVKPDVCILLGDDQHESFHDDNMPSIGIYYGPTVEDAPADGQGPRFYSDPVVGRHPSERTTYPAEAGLGEHLIESLIENEFDVARSNKLPEGRHGGAIGHAFYFVYRRLMKGDVIPNVPVMVNTYYPPNTPTAKRSYKFGQALRKALEEWDPNKRVAIIASGGLSHTVIEEDLDHRVIEGLRHNDLEKLTDYPDVRFRAGTSEIKNWIILAGAMAGDGLQMNLVDYVPCYRTEAGNGCAMGFAEWV
ncbi:MAG TPA: protocatechuate 3,4-dioxygenase [Dehalococcoidia bacterium]|nr:protocatechuate 3,4-dioxygenase [Dehalococcoidia bacterium]